MKEITRNENGYTFIELMSVLVVIGILAAVVALNVDYGRKAFNDQLARDQVTLIEQAAVRCSEFYGSPIELGLIESTAPRAIECENGIEVHALPEGIEATIERDHPGTERLLVTTFHEGGAAKFCRDPDNNWELVSVPQELPCP